MKSILKKILVQILGGQVKRLRKRHDFKIIGVVGSIGKTSTKLVIAQVLASEKRVRFQTGNYNDIVSVPLVFFGQKMPSLWNVFEWLVVFLKNEIKIYLKYPFDIVVVELGTDAPGQISQFRKYLHLDIAVLTAVAPEHMEFFETLQKVAEEEWSVSFFSDKVFANKDLCQIIPENIDHKKIVFYGKGFGSFYKIEDISKIKNGFAFKVLREGKEIFNSSCEALSEIQLYSICAALSVADTLKLSFEEIKKNICGEISFSGRMVKLQGIKNSTIIDDTYNASPDAVKIALDTLYNFEVSQRVAILGMMNELGALSESEHKKIGQYCNPKLLDLVVTIGKDANSFLAPEARKVGCEVYEAKDSVDAGKFVAEKILPAQAGKKGAFILVKGSQNGVFAEEAIKPLLANQSDVSRLVRQDKKWMEKKRLTQ